jgi:hypothetical protein
MFGWSILFDILRSRLLDDEAEWVGDSKRALPRGQGERLVCPLMSRVAALSAPVFVVAQYDPTSSPPPNDTETSSTAAR